MKRAHLLICQTLNHVTGRQVDILKDKMVGNLLIVSLSFDADDILIGQSIEAMA